MPAYSTTIHARCHCEAVSAVLHFSGLLRDVTPRACQCTFCLRHNGLSVSDPHGELIISAEQERQLNRYRFGLKVTDFILCACCGCYIAAYAEIDGQGYGVLNARMAEERSLLDRPAEPMVYDGEDAGSRSQRRLTRWTPARIETRA